MALRGLILFKSMDLILRNDQRTTRFQMMSVKIYLMEQFSSFNDQNGEKRETVGLKWIVIIQRLCKKFLQGEKFKTWQLIGFAMEG